MKKKEIKARVSQEFYDALDKVIFDRRASMQSAIFEGVKLWMGDESWVAPVPEVPRYTKDQQRVVDEVLLYLQNASPSEVHLLRTMLAMKNKASSASEAKPRKDAAH